MCFHQFGPGTWPWALAPWPGPGRLNICTLGGWDQGTGPPKVDATIASRKKRSKSLCVLISLGPGPGPGPWPPGQALGLITFALWGGWDQAQGPCIRRAMRLRPVYWRRKTNAPTKKVAKHYVFLPVWARDLALGLGPLARPWAS